MQTLAGLWIIVQAQMMGQDMISKFAGQSLEMNDSSYIVRSNDNVIDSGRLIFYKHTNHLDILGEEGPIKGKRLRTIYKMEGDKLIICYNLGSDGERPTDFMATTENKFLLLTYKKKK